MNRYRLLYGLALGLLQMLWIGGIYLYDSRMLLAGWEQFNWLWSLLFLIWLARRYRDAQGPALPERTADLLLEGAPKLEGFVPSRILLSLLFPVFSLAYLLKFGFVYALFYYVNPDLTRQAQEKAISIFIANRDPKMSEVLFEESLARFREQDFGPSLDPLGIALMLLGGFLLSFVLSQLFKRERPDLS